MEKEEKKKTETINDTVNTRETKKMNKEKKSKTRMLLVLLFIFIFAIVSYVQLRGSYLEYLELGEKYTNIFFTNLKFEYSIMAINFIVLYFIIYFTNREIKKVYSHFLKKKTKKCLNY